MANLNHIGIAISNLPQMTKLFGLLNLQINHIESMPEQGVMTHFLPLPESEAGHPTTLEFLEPLSPDGTVAKFIQKKGPGIHHLAFSVSPGELEPLCQRLRGEGFRLLYESSQRGAHGMMINFIHPSSAGGILIELTEPTE
jgi:methylmalonyl-CoA/ethylmalonyl-CoA epimerase